MVSASAVAGVETADLKSFVKSRLPGGFAAQTLFGTGRRKSAVARVVIQEGTGKVVINYRDAKVIYRFSYSCNLGFTHSGTGCSLDDLGFLFLLLNSTRFCDGNADCYLDLTEEC